MTTDQPNIVGLLRQLRDDTTTLIREEVVLAKTEMSEKASVYAKNIGFLVAGGSIALVSLLMILFSFAYLLRGLFVSEGMNEGVATFLGFLIVGLVIGIIAAVLVLKGIKTLKNKSLAPEKTIETLKEDKDWAQRRFA